MKRILIAVGTALVALFSVLFWGQMPINGHSSFIVNEEAPDVSGVSSIKVITYNMAYGRGTDDDIISGRKDVQKIKENLNGIAGVFKNKGADIVFLQEVDLASKRTHYIDEAMYLAKAAGFPSYSCVTNWIKNYVPYPYWPPSKHFGRIKSGICILSRFPIENVYRVPLPHRTDTPFFYNAFYMDRAVQVAAVNIGGRTVTLFNVHQEAFDIKCRKEQATILAGLLNNTSGDILVAGDFNSLPPNATVKKGLSSGKGVHWKEWDDVSNETTMKDLFLMAPKLSDTFAGAAFEPDTFTFPSDGPNRKIDYIFYAGDIKLIGARVLKDAGELSDHLPVFAEFL